MRGVYSDHDPDDAPSQPAYVLSAWIGEQLEDVRQAQLKRLSQLRSHLQSETFQWDHSPLAQAIAAFHAAGRELRFLDLRHGRLSRWMGRHRGSYARFAGALERIEQCAREVKKHAAALAAGHKGHLSGARRVLIELEMEWQALNSEVDQGVTWLQDMCSQIGHARAQGIDEPQLHKLAEAAQSYTQQFKHLQGLSTMARDIAVRGNGVLERRTALLEQVKADLEGFETSWMRRLEPLAGATKSDQGPVPGIPKAIEAHDELMKRLSATADACTALQHEEHLMSQQLGMMHEVLEATAAR